MSHMSNRDNTNEANMNAKLYVATALFSFFASAFYAFA